MRALLVDRIRHLQWAPRAAADAAGISVRSAYKWLARYRAGGASALEDRASTPHHQPRRTTAAVTARIMAARYERRTAWAIAVQLQVPRSTVAAVLARAGLNRLARLAPPDPITRYEWAHPGDLVHLDVKPLARIAGVGHRIHGDQRARVRGIGWEYAHVAIDDHSRAAYVEVLPDQTGATTAAFLARSRGLRAAGSASLAS
jgi:transposase